MTTRPSILKVSLYIVAAALAINVGRMTLPMIRAYTATVVPYTVVLSETIVGATGRHRSGPQQTFAVRSDGSFAKLIGSTTRRRVRFASGVSVLVNDEARTKSTTRTSMSRTWVLDPKSLCSKTITGTAQERIAGPVREQVGDYRAVKVALDQATTVWYALDHGCALVKQRMDFGTKGSSELTLVKLVVGEPDAALFSIEEYDEVPPSKLRPARASAACDEDCHKNDAAFWARRDEHYYKYRIQ